jgi:hypothetical protein
MSCEVVYLCCLLHWFLDFQIVSEQLIYNYIALYIITSYKSLCLPIGVSLGYHFIAYFTAKMQQSGSLMCLVMPINCTS